MDVVEELMEQRDAILFGVHVRTTPTRLDEACLVQRCLNYSDELSMYAVTVLGTKAYLLVWEEAKRHPSIPSFEGLYNDDGSELFPENLNDRYFDRDAALEVLDNAIRRAKELAE